MTLFLCCLYSITSLSDKNIWRTRMNVIYCFNIINFSLNLTQKFIILSDFMLTLGDKIFLVWSYINWILIGIFCIFGYKNLIFDTNITNHQNTLNRGLSDKWVIFVIYVVDCMSVITYAQWIVVNQWLIYFTCFLSVL